MSATSLKERLTADIKAAMKGGDKPRLGTLRMMHAAIRQREIDDQTELGDAQILEVLDRMAKRHRESIAQYAEANRTDLVEQEESELAVIAEYLPEPISDEELDRMIGEAVAETGAASMKDMGRVMAELKPRIQGRADMSAVSARVKARLG